MVIQFTYTQRRLNSIVLYVSN